MEKSSEKISAETVFKVAEEVAPQVAQVAVEIAPTKAKKDVKSIAAIILSILAIAANIFHAVH